MRWTTVAAVVLAGLQMTGTRTAVTADDPTPPTLDGFRAAAAGLLEEAHVPGAGIALVRADGIEWTGGIGWADRDGRRPVEGDTLFRVGSISKSFVAMALVQLYEDGLLDLDAPVRSLLPELRMENPWEASDPVRVRHLLEHTAGFDDMHFNEMYVLDDTPDQPLDQVLLRSPASRRVRWRPGTRMAYSNPGYAVAGRVIEAVAGIPFDAFIGKRIFRPLDMTASTFSGSLDDPRLAHGYDVPRGPAVIGRRVYLRPAGALHASARDLGQFVQMLLGWGERLGSYVVDPEYLSNMEWPRTTAAASAGVRSGYGLGIVSTIDLPFHVLGHQGGIDGFASAYGYSPSRDVGFVVLLNASYAPEALTRLSSLAIRYLKRDVEPPPKESIAVPAEALRRFEGYYHDANPRQALLEAITFPIGGRTIRVRDGQLEMQPVLGAAERLVPLNDALFRRPGELTASMAFTTVDGRAVLAGLDVYAERRARWPLATLRALLATALGVAVVAPLAALPHAWLVRRRRRPSAGGLGLAWTGAVAAIVAFFCVAATASPADLGAPNVRAQLILATSLLYPAMAAALVPLTLRAWRRGLRGAFAAFAGVVATAHLGLAGYLGYWGLVGIRTWTY